MTAFESNLSEMDMKETRLRLITEMAGVLIKQADNDKVQLLAKIQELESKLQDISTISINIKNFGYELAKRLSSTLNAQSSASSITTPPVIEIQSKATTQEDMESDWLAFWCGKLHIAPLYHRKLWELCFVAQAAHQLIDFEKNPCGIGFGCGEEPLPSLFASMGAQIVVTDLDPEAVKNKGWAETGQHTSALEKAHKANIISKKDFEARVHLEYVDMNAIPSSLNTKFDFCWSICALEHLGSIQNGLDFIKNSLSVLKPGGVAIHTTEYSFSSTSKVLENGPTVLYRRKHFEELAALLQAEGHEVAPLNFNVGDKPLDRYIDIPPYSDLAQFFGQPASNQNPSHLKLDVAGIPTTCFAFIVRKKTSADATIKLQTEAHRTTEHFEAPFGRTYNLNFSGTDIKFHILDQYNDPISQAIKAENNAILGEAHTLLNQAIEPGIFLDIGANLGIYSFVFAKHGFKTYAFEANPLNAIQLNRTNALNELNVEVVVKAVVAKDGLYQFCNNGPYGFLKNVGALVHSNVNSSLIEGTTLDTWFLSEVIPNNIKMIKMDIEGSELLALSGMHRLIKENSCPPIWVELNGWCMAIQNITVIDFLDAFRNLGYQPYQLIDGVTLLKISRTTDIQLEVFDNYLMLPDNAPLLQQRKIVNSPQPDDQTFFEKALMTNDLSVYFYAHTILSTPRLQTHILIKKFMLHLSTFEQEFIKDIQAKLKWIIQHP